MKQNKWPATIDEKLSGTEWYFHLNPMTEILHRETIKAVATYANGKTIDLGAGRLDYRNLILKYGSNTEYISVDIKKCHDELDLVADICKGTDFADDHFDTAFSTQVLEHVSEPVQFLKEAYRLLKPGGHLILTVPFLFYLHGLPHDYFRYTPNGISFLANEAGFNVIESRGIGGLIAFNSMIFFQAIFHVLRFLPVWVLAPIFLLVSLSSMLDRLITTSARLPAAVILIAKKD
jgi:SAM-dependent methyltransferase